MVPTVIKIFLTGLTVVLCNCLWVFFIFTSGSVTTQILQPFHTYTENPIPARTNNLSSGNQRTEQKSPVLKSQIRFLLSYQYITMLLFHVLPYKLSSGEMLGWNSPNILFSLFVMSMGEKKNIRHTIFNNQITLMFSACPLSLVKTFCEDRIRLLLRPSVRSLNWITSSKFRWPEKKKKVLPVLSRSNGSFTLIISQQQKLLNGGLM